MADSSQFGPAPGYGNTAQKALWPQVAQTAAYYGVNPYIAYSQMVQEHGINPDGSLNVSPKGAQGIFQITAPTARDLGIDPTNNTQNIDGGMRYMQQLLRKYGNDYSLALAAYNAGMGNVQKYGGIPPFAETQNYVSTILAKAGQPSGSMANSAPTPTAASPDGGDATELNRTASAYKDLNSNDVDPDTYNSLFPDIIVKEGLDVTPWYDDPNLITGNPRLRNDVQPVTFQIFLRDQDYFTLSSQGEFGRPIEVQLNASMKNHNLAMKHVFHQQRTRTAFHITMWGMQADVIEGQCTTGVFMNQFGLTDYFSTRTIDDNLKKLVTSGVMFNNVPVNQNDQANLIANQNSVTGGGGVLGGAVSVTQHTSASDVQTILNKRGFTQTSAFRVAAQDAFVEFLSLFKMNGNVWLWNKNYQQNIGENRDWTHAEAWSPQIGLSSAQQNGRNNDVITRGTVLMKFRNFTYEGYFKSLQWVMDASNPFKWDFTFTFQVERTLGMEFVPFQQ
jgi:hypothetical protein